MPWHTKLKKLLLTNGLIFKTLGLVGLCSGFLVNLIRILMSMIVCNFVPLLYVKFAVCNKEKCTVTLPYLDCSQHPLPVRFVLLLSDESSAAGVGRDSLVACETCLRWDLIQFELTTHTHTHTHTHTYTHTHTHIHTHTHTHTHTHFLRKQYSAMSTALALLVWLGLLVLKNRLSSKLYWSTGIRM